jgi:beta-1,2-mannobiose phosphorylase / 1,2-beta-oligomannan phosphorylase
MDIANRFKENPILIPSDSPPTVEGFSVEGLLNPGVCELNGEILLLMRVAERQQQKEGCVSTIVADENAPMGLKAVEYALTDPLLKYDDSRIFRYANTYYLTTRSHLRLARSRDGVRFSVDEAPLFIGDGHLESFGVEDCRITTIDGRYYLTYTAVSESGVGVALKVTDDWKRFHSYGMILPPHNKDCTLFPGQIKGKFACLHRPSGVDVGGNFIWYAESPDLVHWGKHTCIARTREGMWDEQRIGAGAAPILTEKGWLNIYHGANHDSRYCLGALLLDKDDPTNVLARSNTPIMEPVADYEQKGFFGNVIFTNGQIVRGDEVTIYYGASDMVICGATLSISAILATLDI